VTFIHSAETTQISRICFFPKKISSSRAEASRCAQFFQLTGTSFHRSRISLEFFLSCLRLNKHQPKRLLTNFFYVFPVFGFHDDSKRQILAFRLSLSSLERVKFRGSRQLICIHYHYHTSAFVRPLAKRLITS
jgi:hypothetical protein